MLARIEKTIKYGPLVRRQLLAEEALKLSGLTSHGTLSSPFAVSAPNRVQAITRSGWNLGEVLVVPAVHHGWRTIVEDQSKGRDYKIKP